MAYMANVQASSAEGEGARVSESYKDGVPTYGDTVQDGVGLVYGIY